MNTTKSSESEEKIVDAKNIDCDFFKLETDTTLLCKEMIDLNLRGLDASEDLETATHECCVATLGI